MDTELSPAEISAAPPKKPKVKVKKVVKKAKPKAKKVRVKKVVKKALKKPARLVVRTERLDMRLSKAEKAKVTAKAKKARRTVTSIVYEAIERMPK